MSKIFIINEWLWSDLIGENGEEKQLEAISFLKTLYEKCDKIAVGRSSKFQEKEWDFSKKASQDIVLKKIANIYFGWIRYNSQKYEEVDIKEEIDLKEIHPKDVYLVKTCSKAGGCIITTDTKLKDALEKMNIPCKLRDEFLKEYLGKMSS